MLARMRDVVVIVVGLLVAVTCLVILEEDVRQARERERLELIVKCSNPLMRLPECPPR